jgi:hypothetical protein
VVNADAIAFQTTAIPDAGAGEYYDTIIYFTTSGNAALPDTFNVLVGELPDGMSLIADREDNDGDGQPDPDGALTGNARLIGYPRVTRDGIPYDFVVKAISTGKLSTTPQPPGAPALATEQSFSIKVAEGTVNILNPTAEEGSSDPAVPAFPEIINFVNPANPQAFFSFAFETAGGSGNNVLVVYLPRELELSVFDTLASKNPDGSTKLEEDTLETDETNDPFGVYFSDGGVFNIQAGNKKVQIGGFQSPRGAVGKIDPLDADWFQRSPGAGGPDINSQRFFGDTRFPAGDTSLGTQLPVLFSNYFSDRYEGTNLGWTAPDSQPDLKRRKYPFVLGEYANAFFQPPNSLSALRYNAIVEAIDTRGTPSKLDDVISRRAYIVQVKIPEIAIDSVFIDGGTAGVDYNVFVGASGGVPPLKFDLEWVDEIDDAAATLSGTFPEGYSGPDSLLTKDLFGVDIDPDMGSFYGRPRASGFVDLTVRVYAAVMSPSQNPPDGTSWFLTPTVDVEGRQSELAGFHPVTQKAGIHKTFKVEMLMPSLPAVLNSSLDPGVDGNSYRASDGSGNVILKGIGGVPSLVPYPVDFGSNYPANPTVSYEWASTYDQDKSYANPQKGVPGLPNALTLDGDIESATNGEIKGTALDRGFHPVYIVQRDRYVGNTSASTPPIDGVARIQEAQTPMGLSISPDTALYMRGLQSTEGSGGVASGLLDATGAVAEGRMVPLFLQAQMFRATTGETTTETLKGLPPKADILPVGIANGGSRVNLDKSQTTIQGFWPAEAGKEVDWYYYGNRAFRHNQHEMTWLQIPNKEQTRVFMWGETLIKKWQNTTAGMYSRRYQKFVDTGSRGILIVEPRTGNFWIPATFSNTADDSDGSSFGSEFVQARPGSGYGHPRASYRGFYYYTAYDYADYDLHGSGGLGNYIENLSTSSASSTGWYAYDMGRGGVSVAVSDDGLWCATAMPGGDQQKIAIWRTDGKAIDADHNLFANGTVTGVDGIDADGNDLVNSAGIIDLGGNEATANDILPDSLKFVEGGLIFSRYTEGTSTASYSMNKIFGFSLKTGALSEINIQTARQNLPGISSGPALNGTQRCRYIPDQDQIRGVMASPCYLSQWAWAGNKAEEGETGPNAIAFTAGTVFYAERPNWTSAIDREGFYVEGNRNMSLFFMEVDGTGSDGLDLSTAKITDLTGNDSDIYGDLLTPGRPGEMMDFLKVSGDGKYVAVVRDWTTVDASSFSFYNQHPTFAHYYYSSSYETSTPSHDVLLFGTPIQRAADANGGDLDTNKSGVQHVLFVGQRANNVDGGSGPGAYMPAYASANNLINAQFRKITGLDFSEDNTKLFFEYAGHETYPVLCSGYVYGWYVNPTGLSTTYYYQVGTMMIAEFDFRKVDASTGNDTPIDFSSSGLIKNPMKGLKSTNGSTIAAVGPTGSSFGSTNPSSKQLFWARFRSPNGAFLYYVSDSLGGPAHMFGINMTNETIVSPEGKDRDPYVAFALHSSTVQFEQFECNSFNYESRFAAVPAGTTLGSGPNARDGDGIIFVIASDASSKSAPEADLEVYVFDANKGGELKVLTSDVTTGTINAINNLYVSMDANTLAGQRATTTSSRDSRTVLTSQTDLFVVTNVHDVLRGATPNAFILSEKASHGSSVAFVGEGTATGAQAIIYSYATTTGNASWDDRQLFVSVLAPSAGRTALDQVKSHYVVLAGGRKLNDDPDTAD